ncbi:hypothetical protein FQZ97_1134580 [compost metagenome]
MILGKRESRDERSFTPAVAGFAVKAVHQLPVIHPGLDEVIHQALQHFSFTVIEMMLFCSYIIQEEGIAHSEKANIGEAAAPVKPQFPV